MEPLHPDFRKSLKRAHPGLKDEQIDQYEELLSRRFDLEPDKQCDEIFALDCACADMLRETMPKYNEVWREFRGCDKRRARK